MRDYEEVITNEIANVCLVLISYWHTHSVHARSKYHTQRAERRLFDEVLDLKAEVHF